MESDKGTIKPRLNRQGQTLFPEIKFEWQAPTLDVEDELELTIVLKITVPHYYLDFTNDGDTNHVITYDDVEQYVRNLLYK